MADPFNKFGHRKLIIAAAAASYWALILAAVLLPDFDKLVLATLVVAALPFFGGLAMDFWRHAQTEANLLAYCDDLTGLANRRAFTSRAGQLLPAAFTGSVGLILFDVDGLKLLNDGCGHSAGDELLRAASNSLAEATGGNGSLYRIGGDEFAILVDRNRGDNLSPIVERVTAFAHDFKVCEHEHLIQMSFGFASNNAGEDIDGLFNRADQRLRAYKQQLYDTGATPERRQTRKRLTMPVADAAQEAETAEGAPANVAFLSHRRRRSN